MKYVDNKISPIWYTDVIKIQRQCNAGMCWDDKTITSFSIFQTITSFSIFMRNLELVIKANL